MNKKLIVLAVAGAFAMPFAASAKSTVQIYGKARVGYAHIDSGDGINAGDELINPGGSAIGFKGTEDLGGGNAAWFQLETTFPLGTTDLKKDTGRRWTDRNTAIGLKGGWGLVGLGQWTTPYYGVSGASGKLGAFGATDIGGVDAIIGNRFSTGSNTTGNPYSFARRHRGLIFYDSPKFSGFQIKGAFSDNDGKVNTPDSNDASPRLYSLALSYGNGPIYAGFGYEKHKDFSRAGSSDDAWTVGASYKFANVFRVGATYERLKYSDDIAAGSGDTKRNSWGVFGDWYIGGPHSLHVEYVKANSTTGDQGSAAPKALGSVFANGGAGDTGASMWGLKYTYAFSKRTSIDVDYARLNNDDNGHYYVYGGTSNPGQNQSIYGLVMTHVF
jgi:predicted porin